MDLQTDLCAFFSEANYISPWLTLENADSRLLTANSSVIHVKKNEYLFHQGQPNRNVYVVRTGRFRVSFVDTEGCEQSLYIAEKGSMLGEAAAVDEQPTDTSVLAVADSTLYKINVIDLRRIIRYDPEIAFDVMRNLAYKVRLMGSLREYTNKSAGVRICAALLAICAQYGQTGPDGQVKISIRFTHEEMANLNNLNRVTVTKTFRRLAELNAIEYDGGRFTIKDIACLKGIVKGNAL